MKNKISIILIILILCTLFIPIVNAYASAGDVFGGGIGGGASGSGDLETIATESGEKAQQNVAGFNNTEMLNSRIGDLFGLIRWGVAFLTSLGTISSFLILSMAFVRLANAPDNSFQRRNCYIDILKGGLSVICFGGLTLLMTIFYKSFSVFIQKTVLLSSEWKKAFGFALVEFKYLICGVCGVLSITMFVLFLKDILNLASSGGNPQKRAEGIKKIVITGIATMGIGGVGVIVAIFNGLL